MDNADPSALKRQLGALFAAELDTLRRENPGIRAARVCTADGFAMASAEADEESGRRITALMSSLRALRLAEVAQDPRLGKHSHLGTDESGGKCILFDLPSSGGRLLLAASCDDSLLWGQLLTVCCASCENLDRLFRKRIV